MLKEMPTNRQKSYLPFATHPKCKQVIKCSKSELKTKEGKSINWSHNNKEFNKLKESTAFIDSHYIQEVIDKLEDTIFKADSLASEVYGLKFKLPETQENFEVEKYLLAVLESINKFDSDMNYPDHDFVQKNMSFQKVDTLKKEYESSKKDLESLLYKSQGKINDDCCFLGIKPTVKETFSSFHKKEIDYLEYNKIISLVLSEENKNKKDKADSLINASTAILQETKQNNDEYFRYIFKLYKFKKDNKLQDIKNFITKKIFPECYQLEDLSNLRDRVLNLYVNTLAVKLYSSTGIKHKTKKELELTINSLRSDLIGNPQPDFNKASEFFSEVNMPLFENKFDGITKLLTESCNPQNDNITKGCFLEKAQVMLSTIYNELSLH